MSAVQYLENKFVEIKRIGRDILEERIITSSIVAGMLYFFLSNTYTFKVVGNVINTILKKMGTSWKIGNGSQTVFHSIVFALMLMGILQWLFYPLLNIVKTRMVNKAIKNGADDRLS